MKSFEHGQFPTEGVQLKMDGSLLNMAGVPLRTNGFGPWLGKPASRLSSGVGPERDPGSLPARRGAQTQDLLVRR